MIDVGVIRPRFAAVVFDVDSTIAAIEGIDWLARRRGPDVARECAELTTQAMEGVLPLEAVYQRRLAAIAPTREDLDRLAEAYVESVQPLAAALILGLQHANVAVHLLSGGLREALLPLARELHICPHHLHAVDVEPDSNGRLVRLSGDQPLATQNGKPLVLAKLLTSSALPRPVVMVGDGSTDAATRGVVDQFIAYTGVIRRDAVAAVADAEAVDFESLLPLLFYLPT